MMNHGQLAAMSCYGIVDHHDAHTAEQLAASECVPPDIVSRGGGITYSAPPEYYMTSAVDQHGQPVIATPDGYYIHDRAAVSAGPGMPAGSAVNPAGGLAPGVATVVDQSLVYPAAVTSAAHLPSPAMYVNSPVPCHVPVESSPSPHHLPVSDVRHSAGRPEVNQDIHQPLDLVQVAAQVSRVTEESIASPDGAHYEHQPNGAEPSDADSKATTENHHTGDTSTADVQRPVASPAQNTVSSNAQLKCHSQKAAPKNT